MVNRKEIEDRILRIISYIDSDEMLKPLIKNLKMFSYGELLQLLEFLEKWDYKPIYILLDKKIKEYLAIIKEIKQIKVWKEMDIVKQKEKEEKESEYINIEKTLIF